MTTTGELTKREKFDLSRYKKYRKNTPHFNTVSLIVFMATVLPAGFAGSYLGSVILTMSGLEPVGTTLFFGLLFMVILGLGLGVVTLKLVDNYFYYGAVERGRVLSYRQDVADALSK